MCGINADFEVITPQVCSSLRCLQGGERGSSLEEV
jgi:hypothetical protein